MPVPDSGTCCGLPAPLSVMARSPVRAPFAVGTKSTLIRQAAPAAKVVPHFFLLVKATRAKSPLVEIPLMFSVPGPSFVRVTVLVTLVAPTAILPKTREVGDRVTVGPPWLEFTVRFTLVVCVMLPETPVTVTVELPVAAEALAVNVRLLVAVVGFVPNAAVTPVGKPEALRVTLPVKPPIGFTVMVVEADAPCVTETELGDALRVYVGLPEQELKANDEMLVLQSKVPVTAWY